MIQVRTRARARHDGAGDPLDGLVNLFDLGIVLSVAFLVAALHSIDLSPRALDTGRPTRSTSNAPSVVLRRDQRLVPLEHGERRVTVRGGGRIGSVYRLPDGRLVYVTGK